jgi:carboxylesterase type B
MYLNLHAMMIVRRSPVVDGVELMAHPWILAKEGRVNKVPVMQGTCQDEGAGFESQPMSLTQTVLDQLWTQWYIHLYCTVCMRVCPLSVLVISVTLLFPYP